MLKDVLRKARFDVAILDIGIDPDDDLNSDGIKGLEAIREMDGSGTRCIVVTGWQGGDRLDLLADAQQKLGVDWAYMKERYEAQAVIAKLTELLERASERRLSHATPMANLCASMEPWRFEDLLLGGLSPNGGVKTLYVLVARLLSSVVPIIPMCPELPMEKGADGVWAGLYWSRALSTAVAVELGSASRWNGEVSSVVSDMDRLQPLGIAPDLIESVRERNVQPSQFARKEL